MTFNLLDIGPDLGRPRRDRQAPADLAPRPRLRRLFARPARDAAVALLVFGVLSAGVVSHPTAASPHFTAPGLSIPTPNGSAVSALANNESPPVVQIATTASPNSSDVVFRRTSEQTASILLALSFSILAALNLAFFRHLKQAYAHPIRRLRGQKPSTQV